MLSGAAESYQVVVGLDALSGLDATTVFSSEVGRGREIVEARLTLEYWLGAIIAPSPEKSRFF